MSVNEGSRYTEIAGTFPQVLSVTNVAYAAQTLEHGKGIHLPLADPQASPVSPPKICTQLSVTIPPEVGAKHAQDLPYGSTEWARVYHRLRNSIERFNGFAKNDNHEAIERSQRRRVRGIAAQTILLGYRRNARELRVLDLDGCAFPSGL